MYQTESLIAGWQGGLLADSTALIMHLRSIDPQRIIKSLGKSSADEIELIQKGLQA